VVVDAARFLPGRTRFRAAGRGCRSAGGAHGFFFPDAALLVYGASHYWDPVDEISCRWDTEELGLDWPVGNPTLSERDTAAGGYAEFSDAFLRTWATVHGHLPDGQVR
jgi:hypothetical protein